MKLTVMLVDDNLTFVGSVRKFLSQMPEAEVVGEAYDGEEALHQARQLQPDLVLLDINMPGINGLDVARQMLTWTNPPNIVFLSMHNSPIYRAAALELGATGFVGKADFVDDLLPIIERMAAGKLSAEGRRV